MKKHVKSMCIIAAVCLLAAAAFFAYNIYNHYTQEQEQIEVFDKIAEVVEQAKKSEKNTPKILYSEKENILMEYSELFLKNTDMVGWIKIDGTTINFPVMHTPNEPNYYLKHSFEKAYSDLGTPYLQEDCSLTKSDNLIIYGHNINGGKMFAPLENYKDQSFYEQHKIIHFDTITQHGEYEIIAAFKTVAYNSSGFRFYDFVDAENEETFAAYIDKCKELSWYDTGMSAEYGDKLITLSTCEYSAQNGRLVLVAKKIDW